MLWGTGNYPWPWKCISKTCPLFTPLMFCSTKCYKLWHWDTSSPEIFSLLSSAMSVLPYISRPRPRPFCFPKPPLKGWWPRKSEERGLEGKESPAQSHNEAPKSYFVRVFPGSWDTLSSPLELLLRMSRVSRQKREQFLVDHSCFIWPAFHQQ